MTDVATGEIADPLTDDEYADLETLETTISKGLDTFVEVGNALAEIRDRKLYRQYHATFAAYCTEQWEIGKSRAYQLIHAAEVVAEVSTVVDTPLPVNEAQARELGQVDGAEAKAAVMREASEDGPATAPKIKDAAEKRAPTVPVVAPVPEPDPEREMDVRQRKAADDAHNLADRLSRYELVHERTIRLMEARCRRWRETQ